MDRMHEFNRDDISRFKTERAAQSFAAIKNLKMFTQIFDVNEAHG
jgi:hypothetical protein